MEETLGLSFDRLLVMMMMMMMNSINRTGNKCNWKVSFHICAHKWLFFFISCSDSFSLFSEFIYFDVTESYQSKGSFRLSNMTWGPFVNSCRLDGGELCLHVVGLSISESSSALLL